MVVVTVVKMDPLIRQFMHDAVIIFIVMMHLIQLSAAAIMPWLPTTEETVYWTGSSFEVLKKYHTCLAKGIWSHELGQWGSGALLQQLLGISFVAYVVLKIPQLLQLFYWIWWNIHSAHCCAILRLTGWNLKAVITEPHIIQMSNSLELGDVSRF